MKTVFKKKEKFQYAFRVEGIDPDFLNYPFGRQLDSLRKIREFKNSAKSIHVYAKHRATLAAVKEWIKENNPSQFYAQWIKDSSTYKDDSVELFYLT